MEFTTLEEIKEYVQSLSDEMLHKELSNYHTVVATAKRSTLESQLIESLSTDYLEDNGDELEDKEEDKCANLTPEQLYTQNLAEKSKSESRGNRSLTPKDVNSERAYKRQIKLLHDMNLIDVEEQDDFLEKARKWYVEKQKNARVKKSQTYVDIYAEMQKNPDLVKKFLSANPDILKNS